jgi:hypothetical protein
MEVDFIEAAPQVHVHFLTDAEEYKLLGYGKVEVVCHGCGASVLIYYTDRGSGSRHLKFRDAFVQKHVQCPNRGYQEHCSNYRATFEKKDLRLKGRAAKAKTGSRSAQDAGRDS